MSAIKGVVIGMGVLILVGFVVVAITLVTRSKGGSEAKDQFQNMVRLPAGSQVLETRLGDRNILLRIRAGDGAESLVLIDAANGAERGRISLTVGP
jgi:hypothetical protein